MQRASDVDDQRATPEREEARWLTAAEREAWLGLNGLLLKLPALLDGQLERDADLSFFEYMVLAMLSEQHGHRLRMSRLAVLTSGSLSRLSHVAKRLEKQGYIRREPDPGDRRSTIAVLTRAGKAKVTASAPGHVAGVRALVFDHLTPEQVDGLSEISARILEHVDPDGTARPPSD